MSTLIPPATYDIAEINGDHARRIQARLLKDGISGTPQSEVANVQVQIGTRPGGDKLFYILTTDKHGQEEHIRAQNHDTELYPDRQNEPGVYVEGRRSLQFTDSETWMNAFRKVENDITPPSPFLRQQTP